jgi:hypothetical protein
MIYNHQWNTVTKQKQQLGRLNKEFVSSVGINVKSTGTGLLVTCPATALGVLYTYHQQEKAR